MSTRSESIGKSALNGINQLEDGAASAVHAGTDEVRTLTRSGSRWATRQEKAASRQARILKRKLEQQADSLRSQAAATVTTTGNYIKRNPWSTLAIAAGVAVLIGALLGRRRD